MDHLKNKERIQKFKEVGDSRYIYQNELYKNCFQHDIAFRDFKDLTRRTPSDKILHDKAFNIAKNLKYDGYQSGIASMVYKLLDKKTSGSATTLAQAETSATRNKFAVKNESMSNKEFAKELHKPIIRKFETPFVDNIWYADLAIMQLISKFNKEIHFLLCVIVIFSKYAWVIPLKGKKRHCSY